MHKPALYFLTIWVRNRSCLFGEVSNGELKLNDAGRLVRAAWNELPKRFAKLEIDKFIVIPNHIQRILIVGAQFIAPSSLRHTDHDPKPGAMNRALH